MRRSARSARRARSYRRVDELPTTVHEPPRKFPGGGAARPELRGGCGPASGHVLRAPARPAEASGNSPEIWKKINLNYSRDHGKNVAIYL